MLKVKVTEQHEWVRLALTEGDKKQGNEQKLSLTWSYSRDGMSATPGMDRKMLEYAFTKWHNIRDAKTGGTIGEKLHRLAKIAEKCPTIKDFVARMK